jgi:hypothetical protein
VIAQSPTRVEAHGKAQRTAAVGRRRTSRRRHAPPSRPRRLTTTLVAAGTVAGAIASILGLATTFHSVLKSGPEGAVRSLAIQAVTPLTYGEWRSHERVSARGLDAKELGQPGQLISYDVDTARFRRGTELPVRLILHNVTAHRSTSVREDAIKVVNGADCGCSDWIAVPRQDLYYLEIAIFPPGPIRGEPLRTVVTRSFRGGGAAATGG